MIEPIRIDGLKEFSRNLKKINSELPKALRVELNGAAGLVVARAQSKVSRRSGRAARSIKARSTRTEVRIVGGSARVPYYPWLDFGGRVGPQRSIRRPFLKEGRYLYRAYYDLRASGEFQRAVTDALVKAARSAGVEVD